MNKRKPILFTVGALALIGVVGFGYLQVTGQSDGIIMTPTSSKTDSSDNDRPIAVSDQYASFTYPSDYLPVSADPPTAPVLLRHVYTSQENTHGQLAIQITHLANGSLNDDGSYNFRNTSAGRFKQEQQTYGKNRVTVFTDMSVDNFSKVAYVQNGSVAASIALTGVLSSDNTELTQEYASVLSSWQWH